jgi:hypothetical protein
MAKNVMDTTDRQVAHGHRAKGMAQPHDDHDRT